MNKEKNKEEKSILIAYNAEINKPKLNYLIKAFGEEEVNAIMVPDQIRLELAFDDSKELHVVFQLIKGFVGSLITKHPTKVHRDIIISAFEGDGIQYDNSIVDITSRELIAKCRNLYLKLKTPSMLQDLIDNDKEDIETFSKESGRQPLPLKIKRYTPSPELESTFKDNGMFIWDKAFTETIKETGKNGKQSAKTLLETFQEITKKFKEKKDIILVHWFNFNSPSQENPFYISKTLQALVTCIYKDIVERKVNFAAKNPAGTTDNVTHALTKMFEHGKTTRRTENAIQVHDKKNKLIARIAGVHESIMKQLEAEGITALESIVAIRLVRYIIETIHTAFSNNNSNWSDLVFPGGYNQIVKAIGMSTKYNHMVKNLVLLLDAMKFDLPGIKSRLINVAVCKSGSIYTKEKAGGIIISAQPPLRPFNIFNDKNKDSLIIPLLKNPPLIGKPNYHAHLHRLQFKITDWFSANSRELAKYGYVHIPPEQWKEWFHYLLIPDGRNGFHERIIKEITGNAGYLEPLGQDTYTLKNNPKPLKFLIEQGQKRTRASNAGKISAKKRYNTRKRQKIT